jgi:hypothetical protein
MTSSKIIVVWDGEDILSSSIGYILAAKKNWRVVNISNQEDLNAISLDVNTKTSEIVIIHQGHEINPADLPLQFLQDQPTFKLITINLENNMMEVFRKQRTMVRQADDLITVIESKP